MAETIDSAVDKTDEAPLLDKADDYAELFKLHYAYEYVRKNWSTLFGGKSPVSLTEIQEAIVNNYLNIQDESSRNVYSEQPSMEEISRAMSNAKKMTGKNSVKSAMADIGSEPKKIVDEYARYKENKENQLESLRQNAEESAMSYEDCQKLNKNAKRKRFWSVIGKGATILLTGLFAGGYVLGAVGLAGGFAGLTSIATMPFAMLSVATGFLLFKAGGWLVKKIWKKLSDAYNNANTLIKGEEPGSDKYMKQAKSQARANANAYMNANMPSSTVSRGNERARDMMESMLGGVAPVANEEMIEFEDADARTSRTPGIVPPNSEHTSDPDATRADEDEHIEPPPSNPEHTSDPKDERADEDERVGRAPSNPEHTSDPKDERTDEDEHDESAPLPKVDIKRARESRLRREHEARITELYNKPIDKMSEEEKQEFLAEFEKENNTIPTTDPSLVGGYHLKRYEILQLGRAPSNPEHTSDPDKGHAGDDKNEKDKDKDKGKGHAGDEGTGRNPNHHEEKPAGHKQPEKTGEKNETNSIVKDSHDEFDPDQLTIYPPRKEVYEIHKERLRDAMRREQLRREADSGKIETEITEDELRDLKTKWNKNGRAIRGLGQKLRAGAQAETKGQDKDKDKNKKNPQSVNKSHDATDPDLRELLENVDTLETGDKDRLKQLFAKKNEEMTAREKQEYISLAKAFMYGPKSKEEAQMEYKIINKGLILQNNITDEELKQAKRSNDSDEQPSL